MDCAARVLGFNSLKRLGLVLCQGFLQACLRSSRCSGGTQELILYVNEANNVFISVCEANKVFIIFA